MSDLLFVAVVATALLALLARQITSTRSSGWLWSVLFLSALHAWTIVVRPIVNRYDPTGAAKSCGVPPDGWDAVHSSRNNYGGNFGCPADAVSALVAKHAATGVAQLYHGGNCELRQHFVLQALIAEVGAGGSEGGGGPVVASHGFLLGWFRDCEFMSATDHDVDVSIFPAQWNRLSMHRVHWRAIAIALSQLDIIQAMQLYIYPLFGTQRWGETEYLLQPIDMEYLCVEFVCKYRCVFYIYIGRSRYVTSRGVTVPAKTYTQVGRHWGCNVDLWIRNSVNVTHTIEYWPARTAPKGIGNRAYLTKRRPLRRVNPDDFWGLELYVPDQVQEELLETYGPGWNKPVGYWSWSAGMSSLKTKGNSTWLLNEGDGLSEKCPEVGQRMDYVAFFVERIATATLVGYHLAQWALEFALAGRCPRGKLGGVVGGSGGLVSPSVLRAR